jgi:hypothetical protein
VRRKKGKKREKKDRNKRNKKELKTRQMKVWDNLSNNPK